MISKEEFKIGSWVVYPSHGVGKLDNIEKFEVDGETSDFFVISFLKNKLVLRLPVGHAIQAGLRRIASKNDMKNVFDILIQKTRRRKTMWSKRVQEYEAKINSGDPCMIAEVIRDLHKDGTNNAQSFSERQIYQLAMERLAREISVIEQIEEIEAIKKLETVLQAA
ncbi:MAG: CarD family transcriptional regulator [Holosporales bacterium]|jgi:CarD family transcriptional regulator|nr:CarD family transcriptional regulator [Holosporales bacterium]